MQQYKKAMELSSDSVLFLDKNLSITWINKAFHAFKTEHKIDSLNDLVADQILKTVIHDLDDVYEFEFMFKDLHFYAKFSRLENDTFVLVCSRTNHEQTIYDLRYKDVIIDGGNRTFYIENLIGMFDKFKSNPHLSAILLDIDFRNFDRIDHFYGHESGDNILKHFAEELKAFNSNNIVCRVSGTNLTLMHLFETDTFDVDKYMQQVIDVFNKPIKIDDNNSMQILTNMGVVVLPKDGKDKSEALRNVTLAYDYSKKQYEKVSAVFYQESFGNTNSRYLEIEKKLEEAITNNRLELYYQPKIDIENKKIYGFEALLRWNDPELGFVSPLDFISVAEDTGQIVQIGLWVLHQVCLQTNAWQQQGFNFKISLNVSVRQLQDASFISSFSKVIEQTQADTASIELEITESILSEGLEEITSLFEQIKELGFSISLDDFGTSYSSLSYLKNLPIDILKIDRSFINNSCIDPKDTAIVKTIVTLAKELKLEVIAEGVETSEQVSLLEYMECDYIQGYYYYKPMCVDDVEVLVKMISSMPTSP